MLAECKPTLRAGNTAFVKKTGDSLFSVTAALAMLRKLNQSGSRRGRFN
jgi:hypothetical protein